MVDIEFTKHKEKKAVKPRDVFFSFNKSVIITTNLKLERSYKTFWAYRYFELQKNRIDLKQ